MKSNIKKIILLFITFIFIYFVLKNLDFIKLLNIIKSFDIRYVFFLCLSIIFSLSFRALSFKILISDTAKTELKTLIPLCITGAVLNVVLPARAGDIYRAYYTGEKYNADKIKILGAVMLERIFDGLIILSMLFIGIIFFKHNNLAYHLCLFAGIFFISGIICAFLLFKFNKNNKICEFLIEKISKFNGRFKKCAEFIINFINKICTSFINGFEVLNSPKKIFEVILASIGIWTFECLCYLVVIKGFGINIDNSVVLFIISFIALACMIPSASIFLGPYQIAVISAFAMYNVDKESALAISFTEQSVVTITTAVIAVLFLLKNNISFKKIKQNLNEKKLY